MDSPVTDSFCTESSEESFAYSSNVIGTMLMVDKKGAARVSQNGPSPYPLVVSGSAVSATQEAYNKIQQRLPVSFYVWVNVIMRNAFASHKF